MSYSRVSIYYEQTTTPYWFLPSHAHAVVRDGVDRETMTTSKNPEAERIVGLRNGGKRMGIIFDFPCELGYHCPVCKYKDPKDDYDERLEWSEYNGFIWCRVCNKDYPSCLCMPDIDKAIKIYLDTVEASTHK